MPTRNGHEYRQSGVPGIVIFGKSAFRNFTLYAEVADGQVLPVLTGPEWPTVREARAAAARISDLLPWGAPDLLATIRADLDGNRRKLRAALTQEG